MTSNIEKYKSDILKLTKSGEAIFKKMKDNKNLAQLRQDYEMWYSESVAVIKIILPDRISDFLKMYHDDKKKEGLKTFFQHTPSTIIKGWGLEEFGDRIVPPKEIDIALGEHYGFHEKELDFILNYDVKYRIERKAKTNN